MDEQRWPLEWLKDVAPHDPITAIGWRDCLAWASQSEQIVNQFTSDTREKFRPAKSPIERMIDAATLADRASLMRFIVWFNKNIWGDEGLPTHPKKARR